MYEDYMQNLLGVRISPFQDTYEEFDRNTECCTQMNDYQNYDCNFQQQMSYNYPIRNSMAASDNVDLEKCYPEIYNIIYPMVRKACMNNTRLINEDLIDEMTKEIYNNIEAGDVINLNINIENSRNQSENLKSENRETNGEKNEVSELEKETRENRQFNSSINDLIRILLIRELLGRPGGGVFFPPFRPRPPRPMPPRPMTPGGMGPNRPPQRPRF